MPSDDGQLAFSRWMASLRTLTDSAEGATQWRQRRYAFAYQLGELLAAQTPTQTAIVGPAIYGIWLNWGLLYVGQTNKAARRLRDLPIGESHHLANTFPPEIWDRVVVIDWPALPEARILMERLDVATIGLALEHHLQVHMQPLASASQRTKGTWRPIDRAMSKSRGAQAAAAVSDLWNVVRELWDQAASHEREHPPLHQLTRCVRPVDLVTHD